MFPTKTSQPPPKPREWSLSLLTQHFLLIVVVVVLTNVAWTVVFRLASEGPRARELAQLAASTVNLVRAALLAAEPQRRQLLLRELSGREGIRISPAEPGDLIVVPPVDSFFDRVRLELRKRLGQDTQIALALDDVRGLWVSFHLDEADDEGYWLMLPQDKAKSYDAWNWIAWGLLSSMLALAGAALIGRHIAHPLADMAQFVTALGKRGEAPHPIVPRGAAELRTLAGAINRMTEDLAQKESERAEMLAGISHDLRTPLTRLRLETEMSVPNRKIADAMSADIAQLDSIISQFLDYARSEEEEPVVAISANDLLLPLVRNRQPIGQQVVFTLDDKVGRLLLTLRPKAIRRAVDNLLNNAFCYGDGEIGLTVWGEHGEIKIEVSDCGEGVAEADIPRMTQAFTRLNHARSNASGTGLGLAIVERIARIHGGRLQLGNRASGGFAATLVLPQASATA